MYVFNQFQFLFKTNFKINDKMSKRRTPHGIRVKYLQIALEAGEIPTSSPQPGVVVNHRCSGGSGSRNDSLDDEAAALHGI